MRIVISLDFSRMQYSFHLQLFDERNIFFSYRVGNKNKTLVKYLRSDVVTDPVLIIQMEHCRINGFNQRRAVRCNGIQKVSKDRSTLRLSILLAITFAGYESILNCKVVVIDQVYSPLVLSKIF